MARSANEKGAFGFGILKNLLITSGSRSRKKPLAPVLAANGAGRHSPGGILPLPASPAPISANKGMEPQGTGGRPAMVQPLQAALRFHVDNAPIRPRAPPTGPTSRR